MGQGGGYGPPRLQYVDPVRIGYLLLRTLHISLCSSVPVINSSLGPIACNHYFPVLFVVNLIIKSPALATAIFTPDCPAVIYCGRAQTISACCPFSSASPPQNGHGFNSIFLHSSLLYMWYYRCSRTADVPASCAGWLRMLCGQRFARCMGHLPRPSAFSQRFPFLHGLSL